MKPKPIFTVAIMDTNAFDKNRNDFCGSLDSIIPSFFKKLSEKNIRIVTHPVLIGETKKHIRHGLDNMPAANKKIEDAIYALKKHKNALSLTSLNFDVVMKELKQIDLAKDVIQEYDNLFRDAELLPYGDPALVFCKYFDINRVFREVDKLPDKVVIPFCTHEGSGLSGTDSSIESVTGAQVLTAIDMRGSTAQELNDDTKQTVRTWLNNLGF